MSEAIATPSAVISSQPGHEECRAQLERLREQLENLQAHYGTSLLADAPLLALAIANLCTALDGGGDGGR